MEELKHCIGRAKERREKSSEWIIAEVEATLSPHFFASGAASPDLRLSRCFATHSW